MIYIAFALADIFYIRHTAQEDSITLKKYEELDITDAFMFSKVMQDEKVCRPLLEEILNIKIKKIVYLDYEETVQVSPASKGIRMDIYVEDDDETIYNLEMQADNTGHLPKRSRYYQAVIDINILERGADYNSLKESIIIFICTFDLFGQEEYIYTFRNMCQQVPGLGLKDGTSKIFLNTRGTKGDISEELKDFLKYIDGNTPECDLSRNIDRRVLEVRENKQWRREYMSLYVQLRDKYLQGHADGLAEGVSQGVKQGAERINRLNYELIQQGRIDDVSRAATDQQFQEELLKELKI